MLKAISYLHANKLVHRDLKSGNVMLSIKGDIKLSMFVCFCLIFVCFFVFIYFFSCLVDFGLTVEISKCRVHMVGSPFWMPPEMIQSKPYVCLFFLMLFVSFFFMFFLFICVFHYVCLFMFVFYFVFCILFSFFSFFLNRHGFPADIWSFAICLIGSFFFTVLFVCVCFIYLFILFLFLLIFFLFLCVFSLFLFIYSFLCFFFLLQK
jgi:serine/threonine protein kinase